MLTTTPLNIFEELKHGNNRLGESMDLLDQECKNLANMNGQGDKVRAKILTVIKTLLSSGAEDG